MCNSAHMFDTSVCLQFSEPNHCQCRDVRPIWHIVSASEPFLFQLIRKNNTEVCLTTDPVQYIELWCIVSSTTHDIGIHHEPKHTPTPYAAKMPLHTSCGRYTPLHRNRLVFEDS